MPKRVDLQGKRFGKLVVQEYVGKGNWRCLCDCGNEWIGNGRYLREGATKSCGCEHYTTQRGPRNDLTGQRFGKWIVLECVGRINQLPKIHYRCRCDCGNERIVRGAHLRSGASTSCGCERMQHMLEATRLHGCEPKGLYNTWRAMQGRCYNRHNNEYHNYGGRGISICDAWRNSYVVFRDWAFANGWNTGLTIERINVDGNYTPDNCTWVSRSEQSKNTRRIKHKLTIEGRQFMLSDVCRLVGIQYSGVLQRMRRYGETVEEAFFHRLEEAYDVKSIV